MLRITFYKKKEMLPAQLFYRLLKSANQINNRLQKAANQINNRFLKSANQMNNRLLKSANQINNRLLKAANQINNRFLKSANQMNNRLLKATNQINNRLLKVANQINNRLLKSANQINNRLLKSANQPNLSFKLFAKGLNSHYLVIIQVYQNKIKLVLHNNQLRIIIYKYKHLLMRCHDLLNYHHHQLLSYIQLVVRTTAALIQLPLISTPWLPSKQ